MRKIGFIAAASLLILPAVSHAKPLNELLAEKGGVLGAKAEASPAKVSYMDGLRMDFGNATLNANVGVQTLVSYYDEDTKAVTGPGRNDRTSFDVRNTRLELGGSVLDNEFEWVVSNDFGSFNTDSGDSGSTLLDAFIKWNACDEYGLIAGQYKTPSGLAWNIPYWEQQFIDTSIATQAFNLGRQAGVGFWGNVGDVGTHSVGIFNGNSSVDGVSEGQNTGGVDNRVLGVYAISFDVAGDYDRSYEGDPMNTADLAATLGASAYYGQAKLQDDVTLAEADGYGATVDFALRTGGLSWQTEAYYAGIKFDEELANGEDSVANFGLYSQLGYFFVPSEWEGALRFGWVSYDSDSTDLLYSGIEDQYEVNAVVSYYINGHALKFQTGPSWVFTKFADDGADDASDFRYQAGLFGHF